jgi:hypothetical protein
MILYLFYIIQKCNDEDKTLEEVIGDIPQNRTLLAIMRTFEYFTLETFKKRTTCIENPNFLDDFLEVINSINDKTRGQSGWVELTDETNDKGRLVIRGGNQIKTRKRTNKK